ncbi:MAG: alkaline phosphatase [Fretibacterium sp.]|nr:alkaline phosphatase [Fretibacterium sp.]
MKKRFFTRFVSVVLFLFLMTGSAIASGQGAGPGAPSNTWTGDAAKYVFMFIGDGMGLQQVSAAEIFSGSHEKGEMPRIQKLSFTQFEGQGMSTTYSANSFITDSAPAATSLASGYKTDNGIIGMDPAKKVRYFSVADAAKEKGMKVGIVSSVSINHATPAAFYAYVPSRNDYYGIGMQLIDSKVDYFGGGGFHQHQGKEKDKKSLYEIAAEKGITVLRDRDSIINYKGEGRVFAVNPVLDSSSAMPYAIDRGEGELSLAEFTRKGIELLDNPNGFFMQVEGGKIDWACHANDAATSIKDVFDFDEAVQEGIAFAKEHPNETLIIVVGDHETGGMSIGFAGTQYVTFFEKIESQKESYTAFDKKIAACREDGKKSFCDFFPSITESFGLLNLPEAEVVSLKEAAEKGDESAKKKLSMNVSPLELQDLQNAFERSMKAEKERSKDEQTFLLYGGYEPLSIQVTHILNNKAGIGWTTYAHTGIPVPVYAHGVGAKLFEGYYDNTDVAWKTFSVMNLTPKEPLQVN